jgi:cell division septum initiation protein DivIVA
VVDDKAPQAEHRGGRRLVPGEIRNPSFPGSRRSYDRRAVDAYVERVNRVIAELEVSSSPQAAVRHALDRVAEQVGGILQRARETAEQIISSARQEAEENTARAKAEAAEFVVNASDEADRTRAEAKELIAKARVEADEILASSRTEAAKTVTRSREEAEENRQRAEKEIAALREEAEARMRELQADTAAVWDDRRELLDDIRVMTVRLQEVAAAAAARFPPQDIAEREDETPEREAEADADRSEVAAEDEEAQGAMAAFVADSGEEAEPADDEAQIAGAKSGRFSRSAKDA